MARQTRKQQPPLVCKISRPALALRPIVAAVILAYLSLFLCANSGEKGALVMGQITADQASSAITLLLKQNQKSACDGEQLEIKCNDDYVIEIITAELTILHQERHATSAKQQQQQQQDGKVASAAREPDGDGVSGARTAPSSLSPGNRTVAGADAQQMEQPPSTICPTLEFGPLGESASGQTGNATQSPGAGACSEAEAAEVAVAHKARFLSLIKKQCSLLNSCSLDLRLVSGAGASRMQPPAQQQQQPATSKDRQPLAQFLGDLKCPMNRKLLEMAYKCRPTKYRSKAVCRNSRLMLDCNEPGKRLAIGSALYGYWAEDKKTNDRCQLEEERASAMVSSSSSSSSSMSNPTSVRSTTCANNPALALAVLTRECLFRSSCQLQVLPNQFSNCPNNNNQLDHLKVAYVCVNEDLLVTTNASSLLRQLAHSVRGDHVVVPAPGSTVRMDAQIGSTTSSSSDQPPSSSFSSPNVSSSLLLASAAPQQPFITPPSASNEPPPPLTIQLRQNSNVPRHHQQQQLQQPPEEQTSRIYEVLASEPQLNTVHPSNWTPGQRVKFVLLRYQKQLVAFAVITISVSVLFALLVRHACARRSTRQSSASSSSASSKSSSGQQQQQQQQQQQLQQKSFGSSSSASSASSTNCATNQTTCTASTISGQHHHHHHQLLAMNGGAGFAMNSAGHQHHLVAAHQNNYAKMPIGQMQKLQPTNSCSESCFSLDDCNCQPNHLQHRHHHHADKARTFQQAEMPRTGCNNSSHHSPALASNQTTPPVDASSLNSCQQQQQQQPVTWTSTLTTSGARPKLWSFYVNEQHSNSLRLANYAQGSQLQQQQPPASQLGNHAATLRAQRTFSGQAQPTLARNFECLQRQAPLETHTAALEPHQSEYLLTMASVGRQYAQPGAHHNQEAAWFQQEGALGHKRLPVLTLNPAELPNPHPQQQQQTTTAATSDANAGPTCAVHSQQQPFSFDPTTGNTTISQPILVNTMNLEFEENPPPPPPASATTIQQSHHHQFQLPH